MDMLKASSKINLSRAQIVRAALIFFTCFVLIFGAVLVKFLLITRAYTRAAEYVSLAVALLAVFVCYFMHVLSSRRYLVAIPKTLSAVLAAFTFSIIACLFFDVLNPYVMPVALAAFLIAPVTKRRDAFVANFFLCLVLLIILISENSMGGAQNIQSIIAVCVYGLIGGTVAAFTIASSPKRIKYLSKGLLIVLGQLALLLIFMSAYLPFGGEFWLSFAYAALGGAITIVLGVVLQSALEAIFNLVTNARLVELTDRNAPLIKRLMEEAPGTFNHSLAVANFAELCAHAIGENPYLARACAYYHDIGKIDNAIYFKENQADYNPHDELLPEVSADIIRSHTTLGEKLCRKYRIPEEITHVTVQHHGTLPIAVFLNKARRLTDVDMDTAPYYYQGITPVSKIAAIIMICDSAEAAIRAMDQPDGEKIDKLLRGLIGDRLAQGQFDKCDISLMNLDTIRSTIINAYGGLYHKRLKYPDGKK